jgi:hypothetical protein
MPRRAFNLTELPPLRRIASGLTGVLLIAAMGVAAAGPDGASAQGDGRIYSCIDASGRRLSSDRPIPECLSKEQRLLNRDGSMRAVVPPARSAEDVMREEAAQRLRAQESAARDEAVRRDRTLLIRYPDDKSHDSARQRALEPVLKLIDSARARVARLEAESDDLTTARAALGFKPVPEDLKARIGINEGALEAHRNILRKEEAERDRLNLQFDTERMRLQQLWGGAAPGSEPPPPPPASAGAGRGRSSPPR